MLTHDPCDWVLARARFFLSDAFKGSLNHIKVGRVTVPDVQKRLVDFAAPGLRRILGYE